MNDIQRNIKTIEDALEKARHRSIVRGVLRSVAWFTLPFLGAWGLGVPAESAAQVAVTPWACATALQIALHVTGWATTRSWLAVIHYQASLIEDD